MELNISRISSTVRVSDSGAAGTTGALSEQELDALAAQLLPRQQRLCEEAAARDLAPDDPAGELWSRC